MSSRILALALVVIASAVAAAPHSPFDDCEANFVTPLGAYPAQFSPLHQGELGQTRLHFRPSNQRAIVHRDFGRAVWTLEIRGPEPLGGLVYSTSGQVTLDDGKTPDVEVLWNGRTKAGKAVATGHYLATLRTRFVPHRVFGKLGKELRSLDDADPAIPGVEEAETQRKELVVDQGLPLARAREFAAGALVGGCQTQQNAPLLANWPWNFYYGSMHSHSLWSDGGLGLGAACGPSQYGVGGYDPAGVFNYARNTAGMDFWMVNEHNHIIPDSLRNSDPPATGAKARARYQAGLAAAKAATVDGSFVALYGMEWGEISSGGHVTLIETPKLFGWECTACTPPNCPLDSCFFDVFTASGDYRALLARSVENPSAVGPLGIMAHPQLGDYNDYFVDTNSLQAVQGIAIRSGLGFTDVATCSDANVGSTDFTPRWRQALAKGFKLGPIADHDAHCANWGTGIPTRTVYLLRNDALGQTTPGEPVLTKKKLLEAHKARHFFASEDSNAQLVFGTADGAQIMGDSFSVGASVTLRVQHADPEGALAQTIRIYRGTGTSVSSTAYKTFSGVSTVILTESITAGNVVSGQTYWYYARVTQNDAALHELFSAPMWITYGAACVDATPPVVNIAGPAAGSTIACGDSTIAVSATDPGGIASVEVRVDGGAWSAATRDVASGNYLLPWASSQVADGAHLIEARATDSSCGRNTSAPFGVTINRLAAPLAAPQPAALDFGNFHTGQTAAPLALGLQNPGCAALDVSSYSITGPNAAEFSANPPSGAASVLAGGSTSWSVVFTPAALGARTATLTFSTAAGDRAVTLAGAGALPLATLAAASVGFGNVRKFVPSAPQRVTLSNPGLAGLAVSGWALSGTNATNFTTVQQGAAQLVPAGGALALDLVFTPSANGTRTGTLTINTELGARTVSLTGTGVFPTTTVTPSSLAFGDVRKGTTSASLPVAIKNTGTDVLHLTGWDFDGPSASEFLTAQTSTPTDVAVNQTFTLQVALRPTVVSAKAARLLLHGDSGDKIVTLSGNGTAPTFTLAPDTLSFGDQRASQTSAPQAVTVVNTGNAALTVSAPVASGAQAADFGVTGPATTVTLGGGEQAVWQIFFTPGAAGARVGTLTFQTDGGPKTVALSGNGTAPLATLSAAALAFGDVRRNTTSAPRSVSLDNGGSAPLALTGWALAGVHPGSFTVSPASAPISLQPTGRVTLDLRCAPTADGPRSAVLSIATELGAREVALTCNGLFPVTQLSAGALTFADQRTGVASAAQTLTLTNAGTGGLTVAGFALTGANPADFVLSPASTSTAVGLGQGASWQVAFNPGAVGPRAATITFTCDDGPKSVALSGSGIAPGAALSTSSLAFGSQRQGTLSPPQSASLSSTGTAPLLVSGYDLTGANPGDFLVDPPSMVMVIPAGTAITGSARFAPTGTGPRSATVTFHTDAGDQSGTLTGTGLFPAATLSAQSVAFGNQRKGTTSAAQTVTLTNSGTDLLSLVGPAVTGNASDFVVSPPPGPVSLAPGASASWSVAFAPGVTGARSAALTFTGDLTPSVTLAGTGVFPTATVSTTGLAFGNRRRGTASAAQTVTLTNTGTAALTATSAPLSGAGPSSWSVTPAPAPVTLGPGDAMTWSIAFLPDATGPRDVTWTLLTDDGPRTIALTGTGLFPHASLSLAAVAFGDVRRGAPSAAQALTLTNTGTDTLNLAGFDVTGVNAGDLAITPASTPLQLAPGQGQTWSLTLTPSSTGPFAATIAFHGDEGDSVIPVSGNGVFPAATPSTRVLVFPDQRRGTSSTATTLTLVSSGTAPLAVLGYALSGTAPGDFLVTPASATSTLAVNAQAQWSVQLRPTATGARAATLTVNTDAGPLDISLSGRGIFPAAVPAPTSVSFGDQALSLASPAQSVLLANAGTDTLAYSARSLLGAQAAEFAVTGPSSGSIAAGASVTLSITFTPAASGARAATLRLTTELGDQDLPLSGNGVSAAAAVSPGTLDFGDQRSPLSSAARTVTLSNGGGAALSVTGFTLTGSNPADFTVTPASGASSVPSGGQATWAITFTPGATGARAATLTFQTGVGDRLVSLVGRGTTAGASTSVTDLAFGPVRKFSTAASKQVSLTNSGTAPLSITPYALTGANANNFAVVPAPAARSVAPGETLTWDVTFTPSANGARVGTLTLNTELGARNLNLTGTGIFPTTTVTPATPLAFGNQRRGTSSAAQTVTLKNTGTDGLTLSAWAFSGPNPGDFSITPAPATLVLAKNQSQLFSVVFTPSATGARAATLTFTGDNGASTVSLTGAGIFPTSTPAASAMAFADQRRGTTSAPQTVVVTNTGTDTLALAWSLAGAQPGDFAVTPAGPVSLAPLATTSLSFTFTPTSAGARAATLTLQGDDASLPLTLSGNGIVASGQLSAAALTFAAQRTGTTAAAQTVSLTNVGNVPLSLSGLTLSGDAAAEYTLSPGTVPASLAPSASASWTVTFTPAATGARVALFTIKAEDKDQVVALAGTGTAPLATLSGAGLAFGDVRVSATSAAQPVTLSNGGTAPLAVTGFTVTGASSTEFAVTPSGSTSIAAGGSATWSVTLRPSARGPRVATLTLSTELGERAVSLAGNGVSPGSSVSPTALAFGDQRKDTASAALSVKLTNSGNAPLLFTAAELTGAHAADFSVTPAGAQTLAPAASATFAVAFKPSATGARAASLALRSDAADRTIALTGNGTAPTAVVSPAALAFSAQRQGTTASAKSVLILNTGDAALTASGLQVDGAAAADYDIRPVNVVTVGSGDSAAWQVTFTPTQAGDRPALLTVNTDDGPRQVSLGGRGVLPQPALSKTDLVFGGVRLGVPSMPVQLELSNLGEAPLSFSGWDLTGTGAANFTVLPASGPLALQPGEKASWYVTFTAGGRGDREARLAFQTDTGTLTAKLTGTGLFPVAALSVDALAFGEQRRALTSAGQTVTLRNDGTDTLSLTGYALSGAGAGDYTVTPSSTPAQLPAGQSASYTVVLRPSATGARDATLAFNSDDGSRAVKLSGTGVAPVAATLFSKLDFGVQRVSQAAGVRTVGLSNTGSAPLSITAAALSGPQAGDYSLAFQAASIGPGEKAAFPLGFTPGAVGARAATITFDTDDGQRTVDLAGQGGLPDAALSPAAVDFGDVRKFDTSTPLQLVISNPGTVPLLVKSLALGGARASNYLVAQADVARSIPAGGSANWDVTFHPSANGSRPATLTAHTDAGDRTITLAGNGIFPTTTVRPLTLSLTFGDQRRGTTSASQIVTIENTGTDALNLGGWDFWGPAAGDFSVKPPSAKTRLARNAKLNLEVTSTPSGPGARFANLSVHGDNPDKTLTLVGNGVAPITVLSSSALSFDERRVGDRSPAQVVTVQNLGTDSVTLSGAVISGPSAVDFTTDFTSLTLAPGAQGAFGVTFRPGVAGERTASLKLSGDDGTHDLALGGTGTAPAATLSPAAVLLPGARVGGGASASQVSLTNDGTAPLAIAGYTLSGANAGDFVLDPAQVAFSLAPGATATWVVAFKPTAAGPRAGTVTFQTDAGSRAANLSGAAFTAVGRVSADALAFSGVLVGATSAAQTVDLFNDGTGPLLFLGGALSGPAAANYTATLPAPRSLQPGASLRTAITFTPSVAGARDATLTLHTDAGDRLVSLSGQGTLRSLALSENQLVFAALTLGTKSPAQTVAVRNTGAAAAQVTSWALSGPQAGDFDVTPASSPQSLAPGAALEVQVVFTPTAAGTRAALLRFETDVGALVVPLAGAGTETPLARSSGCSSPGGSGALLLPLGLLAALLVRRRSVASRRRPVRQGLIGLRAAR